MDRVPTISCPLHHSGFRLPSPSQMRTLASARLTQTSDVSQIGPPETLTRFPNDDPLLHVDVGPLTPAVASSTLDITVPHMLPFGSEIIRTTWPLRCRCHFDRLMDPHTPHAIAVCTLSPTLSPVGPRNTTLPKRNGASLLTYGPVELPPGLRSPTSFMPFWRTWSR